LLRFQLEVKDKDSDQWRYLEEQEYNQAIPVIKEILHQHAIDGAQVYLAGSPIMVANLEESMMRDMQLFTGLTLVIIAFFLWFLFRSSLSVIIPLLCVVLSLLLTVAAMAWFKQPLQVPSVILPSFILAVGIGDAVHLLTIYFKNIKEGTELKKSMVQALEHTFMPMLLTSITTAAGLFSFSQTDLVPLANLGLFSSLGVMVAFILTVTLLPACFSMFTKQSGVSRASFEPKWINTFTKSCLAMSFKYPMRVIVVIVGILLIAGMSASRLHFSHNPMVWIPSDWPVHSATQKVDDKMGGTVAIELIIDTQQVNGLYNSELMKQLDKVAQEIRAIKTPHLTPGKVVSVVEMLKETEQALHGNEATAYRIPYSNELVAQQLFLLEMSGADDLYKLVDRDYQTARISITAPWVDSQYYQTLMDQTQQIAKQHLPNALITTTGIIPIFGSTLTEVIHATAKSYMLAFAVISIMMILLLRSFGYGLLAMIPNLSPIIIVMGMLYWVGAPLDMFTMLIGSIAIGLSVDDTVHFMYHYKQYRLQGLSNEEAITHTLNNSGRAMLITSIVLACGFFIFTASSMNNLFFFGIFTGLTIILALLADFILAPALLVKLHKWLHR
jgi:predicted RND superfamily exporter protein